MFWGDEGAVYSTWSCLGGGKLLNRRSKTPGFHNRSEGEMDPNFSNDDRIQKGAGGKVQNSRWLSTWLISGPGLRHNCIFIHQFSCSLTSATIIQRGALRKVVRTKQLRTSAKENVSTCFPFACASWPFEFKLTSYNCLIPLRGWNQLGIYNFYISCLKTQLHRVRNANDALGTKTFPTQQKKRKKETRLWVNER